MYLQHFLADALLYSVSAFIGAKTTAVAASNDDMALSRRVRCAQNSGIQRKLVFASGSAHLFAQQSQCAALLWCC